LSGKQRRDNFSAFPDFDLGNLRYVGVLPRIAVIYLVTSLLVLLYRRQIFIKI